MNTIMMLFITVIIIAYPKILLAESPIEGRAASDERLQLTWTLPSERTNGNPLMIEELSYSTLTWVCNGVTGNKAIEAPESTTTVGMPEPGECTYYVSVTDKNGLTSSNSEPYEYVEQEAAPVAPTWDSI